MSLIDLEPADVATDAMQLCTFQLGDLNFGVDVQAVQEVIRFQETTPVPLAAETVHGLMNLRGQIVTTLDLRRRLGLPPRAVEADPPMNVVLRTDDGAVALLVDAIGDVIDVGVEAYEPPLPTLRGPLRALTIGTYKLPEGLVLVLDHAAAIDPGTSRGRDA